MFERKADALAWARRLEAEVDDGAFVDRSEARRATLGELLERYTKEISCHKRGGAQEANHIKVIREDPIAAMSMSRLGSADIAKFRDRMRDKDYAPATIVRRLNLIASIINHARAEWRIHVHDNVAGAKLVKRPAGADHKRERRLKPPSGKVDPETGKPEKGEEERLFDQLAKERHATWLTILARLAIETAARQGELCSLRWPDIDLDKRVATIRGLSGEGSKNGEIRRIPLSPVAVEVLRSVPRSLRDQRIFPLDQATLKVGFLRAVERAGLPDLTFHDLRHEATSRLAKIYNNPLELMRITGHKTLGMLARYYHADAEELATRMA
jgi:integrase